MLKPLFISLLMVGKTKPLPFHKAIKLPVVHYQLKTDTAKIGIRQFNADSINKLKYDPAFNYHIEKTGISLWDRFWNWVWLVWTNFWDWVGRLLEKLFGHMGHAAGHVMEYLILGIAAASIVYVIFKLFGINLLGIFKKDATNIEVPYSESVENIHEINFDDGIEDALAVKNYRIAVRLLYLRCLKQLSDAHLINWKIEKTNTAYLNELTDAGQKRQFANVIRQFEYVWYGDFPVDGQSFQNINNTFQEFKRSLL
jgi:hypothetical protein